MAVLEVGDESLAGKAPGFAGFDLRFSKSDLPVEGWYTVIVTGPERERFTIVFTRNSL
jgi:hypothetical protein